MILKPRSEGSVAVPPAKRLRTSEEHHGSKAASIEPREEIALDVRRGASCLPEAECIEEKRSLTGENGDPWLLRKYGIFSGWKCGGCFLEFAAFDRHVVEQDGFGKTEHRSDDQD